MRHYCSFLILLVALHYLSADFSELWQALDSAFVSVCASADKDELLLLLAAGADVNAKLDGQQEGAEGFTALMWAVNIFIHKYYALSFHLSLAPSLAPSLSPPPSFNLSLSLFGTHRHTAGTGT